MELASSMGGGCLNVAFQEESFGVNASEGDLSRGPWRNDVSELGGK